MGRDPDRGVLRSRPHRAPGPQLHGLHAALSRGPRARPVAGFAARGARRRGRGLRRGGPAELRAPPGAHAPGLGVSRQAAHARHPRHLRDLRPALPRWPHHDGALLRGAAHPARAARAGGAGVAHARVPPRRGKRAAGGHQGARHRGRGGEEARLPVPAGRARLALDQGEERPHPGRGDRRLDSGRGRSRPKPRRARRGRVRGRAARVRGEGRHRLHRADARAAASRARAAQPRHQPVRRSPATEGHDLRGAAARRARRVPRVDEERDARARPPSRASDRTYRRRNACAKEVRRARVGNF